MKYVLMIMLLTALLVGAVYGQQLSITAPNRFAMLEGQIYKICWTSRGIDSVNVVVHGTNTPVGDASRGDFNIVVADSVPAATGYADWQVPWIDSINIFVKLKGYDSSGKAVAVTEKAYGFRPAVLAGRTIDGIYLDLHAKTNQRLYVQKNHKLIKAYLATSSAAYYWLPPNHHINKPHDHAGVFSVLDKVPLHHSKLFDVDMPWAMRYHGGHFVHATSPDMYQFLGMPASSGCNRMTYKDAKELYMSTPVGTRLEVIGPGG